MSSIVFQPKTKNKSRLGSDFWGLASSFLERVVIPSVRNPRDDSIAKVTLFLETASEFRGQRKLSTSEC